MAVVAWARGPRRAAGLGVAACAAAAAALALGGCGSGSNSSQPTVSLWLSATVADYRQVAAGAKLALAQRGGRAGPFRINFAGQQVSDDASRATADAVNNARQSLQDTQASAVITNVGATQAESAITLLNEAGVPTVAIGDAALQATVCSARSTIYPSGRPTAIVVPANLKPPLGWDATFKARLGFAPTAAAWQAYEAAQAVLTSLGQASVKTGDTPPRLNRAALAAELVRAHGGCG